MYGLTALSGVRASASPVGLGNEKKGIREDAENYDSVWVEFSHKAVKDAADCESNHERDSQIASMIDRRFVAYVFTCPPIHG